jgi:hypothetical protein
VNALLLTAAGLLFTLIFILNVFFKTVGRAQRIGFWDLLLVFVPVTLLVLAQVHATIEPPPPLPVPPIVTVANIARGVALILLIFGVLMVLFEVRREQRLRGSRGIMSFWAGLLVLIASFTVPVLRMNFSFEPGGITLVAADGSVIRAASNPGATPGAESETESGGGGLLGLLPDFDSTEEADVAAAAAPTDTLEPSPTFTVTPSRTPRPTPSPTSTREPFIALRPTAESTSAAVNPGESCLVSVEFNLRLRALPNRESETLVVIPFGTNIQAYGRNRETSWWYVEYESQFGWVDAEFARADERCDELPVRRDE